MFVDRVHRSYYNYDRIDLKWTGVGKERDNMGKEKKLPIGIEDFEEIRTEDFYYVDKTDLITELLDNWSKVNLFTRPRRFGKSLNMSMLKAFFGYGYDSRLFDGTKVAKETELCERYMGQFPVISITLKDVEARDYEGARAMLCAVIGNEALRFTFLSDSDALSEEEKERYRHLIRVGESGTSGEIMSDEMLKSSLFMLSRLLRKHYGKKVILLIDEYDVPLDKAQHFGYHDEMIGLIRSLLSQALKSNDNMYFAVLTGCLRIAKESIFTGLNNLNVFSITNVRYKEHFGFLDEEVREMLAYYGLEDRYGQMKEWYDGYRFGDADIYCPWDVINHIALVRSEPYAPPRAFWANTSGNEIIRTFIGLADQRTRREIERLVEGESVVKKIDQELTYKDLYDSIDNLWSVLFTTGYLTQRGREGEDTYRLAIPDLAIRQIFVDQILKWSQAEARKDTPRLDTFCEAFVQGDAKTIERQFSNYLQRTISIRDTSVRKEKKENFYHGILLGLLSHREDWDIRSNAESGDGFSDILIEIEEERIGIVIEVKYPDDQDLEAGCKKALDQIEKVGYQTRLCQDGMETVYKYGIACWKKRCMVRLGESQNVLWSDQS